MTEADPERLLIDQLRDDPERLRETVREMAKVEAAEVRFGASEEYRGLLTELFARFTTTTEFAPGDLVAWKRGLKNKNLPLEGSCGIVIEQLETPLYDSEKDTGDPYFREPLDLAVGLIGGSSANRRFLVYWFDSRRLELYEPSTD